MMRPRSSRSNDLARSNDPARVAGPRMRDVAIVLAAGTLDGLLVRRNWVEAALLAQLGEKMPGEMSAGAS